MGFDLLVSSDHYSPWLESQGHSPYAWTLLGRRRAGHRTGRADDLRDLPDDALPPGGRRPRARRPCRSWPRAASPWASAAARRLNEHTIGEGWPGADVRQDMLAEAIEVIRKLARGRAGDPPRRVLRRRHRARLGPARPGCARSPPPSRGEAGIERFAPLERPPDRGRARRVADRDLERRRRRAADRRREAAGRIGQIPICWDPDEDTAKKRAHDQFRWFGGGWAVNADLPTPAGFAGATAVRDPGRRGRVHPLRPRPRRDRRGRLGRTGRPGSPTSPSSRSATRARSSSSPRPPGRC